jgi:hypothetical protein
MKLGRNVIEDMIYKNVIRSGREEETKEENNSDVMYSCSEEEADS